MATKRKTRSAKKGSKAKKSISKATAAKKRTKRKTSKKKPGKKKVAKKKAGKRETSKKKVRKKESTSTKDARKRSAILEAWAKQSKPVMRCVEHDEATQCVHALSAFKDNWARLVKLRNVCGIDIGRKISDNRMGRRLAVRLHVHEKRSDADLPKSQRIAKLLGNVPTDVIVRDYRMATTDLPLGGEAIAPEGTNAFGTMGVDVFDPEGRVRMLTAAHVVARNITQKTRMQDEDGDFIGVADTQRGTDWQFNSLVDCALIDPPAPQTSRRGMRPGFPEPRGIRRANERDILNERTVIMIGARTDTISIGKVTAVNVKRLDGDVLMEDHVEIMSEDPDEMFALQGDSGSICVIGRQIIGLLRAVDERRRVAIACQMAHVRSELNVSLD